MNVFHHIVVQLEALVNLVQETHCNNAEKLVLPGFQLGGSSFNRKYGLAPFVHERLRHTLLDQSPPTSKIEWFCMDVDDYKIVNVYKPPPTQLQSLDFPMFHYSCLYTRNFYFYLFLYSYFCLNLLFLFLFYLKNTIKIKIIFIVFFNVKS